MEPDACVLRFADFEWRPHEQRLTQAGVPVDIGGRAFALLGLLATHGSLIIMEPALRETSRNLLRVRDALVAKQACTVYSPCLHEKPCPALVKDDDWCHEERPWTPPVIVAAIDREVGLIKDALKFSYVILRKIGRAHV